MAMDQAHEQMTDLIKGYGDVNWITKWITAGPEISRIVVKFENPPLAKSMHHHDQQLSIKAQFASHVKAMVAAFA